MDWRYLLEGDLFIELGSRFRSLRKQSGMSQKDLADQIGTTRERISDIERGKNTSVIYFLRILKVFNKINELEEILTVSDISPKDLFNKTNK